MNDLQQAINEIEHMAEALPQELFKLHAAICKRLTREKIEYESCESDGMLVFSVFYENTCENLCTTTFGVTPDGSFHAVGKEWDLPPKKTGAILFCLHDTYEFSSLKRLDPFDDDSGIIMDYGAQIDMLLSMPDIAAEFCLKMAEKVASESYEADQDIYKILNA